MPTMTISRAYDRGPYNLHNFGRTLAAGGADRARTYTHTHTHTHTHRDGYILVVCLPNIADGSEFRKCLKKDKQM